jgi:hypothetical protein
MFISTASPHTHLSTAQGSCRCNGANHCSQRWRRQDVSQAAKLTWSRAQRHNSTTPQMTKSPPGGRCERIPAVPRSPPF